ncbi:MAG: helix-turn-helix transcriptional regulator [Clostridia bacterium]|nr:helix-turn-helix transcriptional regulator [Clostridia bacterium]
MVNNRLRELRTRKGLSQQQAGKLVGVSRQTISRIERREYCPSVELAMKLASQFDVKVDELFAFDGN